MNKSSHSSLQARRWTLRARAICVAEILLAYLGVFFVEIACLFPAVWVR